MKVKDDKIKELNTKVRNLANVVGGFVRMQPSGTAWQLTSSHGPQHLQLCQNLQPEKVYFGQSKPPRKLKSGM